MRLPTQVSSPISLSVVVLIFLFIPTLFLGVMADERSDNTNENEGAELRVVIPAGDDAGAVIDKDIRRKMLSEKLIKMGRAKSQSCTRCHGRTGMKTLANATGWDRSIAEFVVKHLTELREGMRVHAVMSSIAKPLSDQDIALIAAWYQSVSPGNEH